MSERDQFYVERIHFYRNNISALFLLLGIIGHCLSDDFLLSKRRFPWALDRIKEEAFILFV